MLNLLEITGLSKTLLAIIIYFTNLVNAEYKAEYECTVNFNHGYFFDNERNYGSLDSGYLARAMANNLKEYDKNTVRYYTNSGAVLSLAGFLKGRLKRNRNSFEIDVAMNNIPEGTKFPIWSQNTYLGSVPYYNEDTAYFEPELKEVYGLLGEADYYILFYFLHETRHWINLVEAGLMNYGGVFFVKKGVMKTEDEIDDEARQMMIDHYLEIKEIAE